MQDGPLDTHVHHAISLELWVINLWNHVMQSAAEMCKNSARGLACLVHVSCTGPNGMQSGDYLAGAKLSSWPTDLYTSPAKLQKSTQSHRLRMDV